MNGNQPRLVLGITRMTEMAEKDVMRDKKAWPFGELVFGIGYLLSVWLRNHLPQKHLEVLL